MTTTNYNDLIPNGVLFSLLEVQEMKLLKVPTAKKLIDKGLIEVVRVGTKLHISRAELIKFLESNTTEKKESQNKTT